jgi:hypothetical protein
VKRVSMTMMNKLLEIAILLNESLLFILKASIGYFNPKRLTLICFTWVRILVTMKFD